MKLEGRAATRSGENEKYEDIKSEVRRASSSSDIDERTFWFACRIVNLYDSLSRQRGARHTILAQLLRSGTGVGANLTEARGGQSRADFISKCRIALKEARESYYWLRILRECRLIEERRIDPLVNEADQIVAILTSIVKRATSSQSAKTE